MHSAEQATSVDTAGDDRAYVADEALAWRDNHPLHLLYKVPAVLQGGMHDMGHGSEPPCSALLSWQYACAANARAAPLAGCGRALPDHTEALVREKTTGAPPLVSIEAATAEMTALRTPA